MKRLLLVPAALAMLSLGAVAPASAGCITGAIVGGIAGHMAGHGKVGAAAGCAYGVHRAHKAKARHMEMNR
jgi:hypothetical protein